MVSLPTGPWRVSPKFLRGSKNVPHSKTDGDGARNGPMKSRVWLDYWSDIEGECQAQRDGKKATRQSSIAEISSAERFCAGRGYGDTFMEMFQGEKRVGWASGVQAETRWRKTQLCLPEAAGPLFSLCMWNGEARLGGRSRSCVHVSSNFLPSTSRAPGTVLITRHITVHSDTRKHKCEFTFLSLKQWR